MKRIKLRHDLWAVILAICALGVLTGCNPAPSPALRTPEAPVINTTAPVTPMVTAPSPATTQPAVSAVSPAVSTATPSPSSQSGIQVASNSASLTFPDKITFSLQAVNSLAVTDVSLEYGTDKHTLTDQTTRTKVDFQESQNIKVSWDWQMKKSGSLPPGMTVWWQWILTDKNNQVVKTPRSSLVYTDTRFSWQVRKMASMDVYWHDQNQTLMNTLIDAVQSRLERIQLNVTIPPERKPKIFVYTSSNELRQAVLFTQDWTGALAFPDYNIILTAVSADSLDWAKGALPHEITHLLVGEAVFGPFGDIPTWLNEGLAEYSEIPLADNLQKALIEAVKNNQLITLRSLAGSFPADAAQASLAYAESSSVVAYLIDTYGWEKMRSLLAGFKDGTTYDKGLQSVYSVDLAGLETQWRATLKTK